jgi:hypothetical protein
MRGARTTPHQWKLTRFPLFICLVSLADFNRSAEWPGIKTEIPQKKHGQRQQKFLPIVFHVPDIQ